ncbi:polysaccharide biosynthesis protein [bacterium]|nr:polysaccharide biosynthesis protein [bacterium]
MKLNFLKNPDRGPLVWLMVVSDALLCAASFLIMTFVHASCAEKPFSNYYEMLCYCLPIIVVVRLVVFACFSLYRSGWRYAGLHDAVNIAKAVSVSTLVACIVTILVSKIPAKPFNYSVYIFLGDMVIATVLITTMRFSMRLKKEFLAWRRTGRKNVLIVGAGDAGVMLLREINANLPKYAVVGFIDDDPKKLGMLIQGVPVLGNRSQLETIVHTTFTEEVFIAIPSASGHAIKEVAETCNTLKIRYKTLPSVNDIVDGKVTVSDLREVDILDVLRRDPVELDLPAIKNKIRGKRVLVTGAGGSIGSEMCRQIALFKPEELILLELCEFNLYQIDRELRAKFPELKICPYIADIKNEARLDSIFSKHHPQIVFHAAAYKHVPIMELNPLEAVLNNVKGTYQIACAADKAGCEEFIQISTDKAVKPSSIMGATKRVAEKFVQSLNTISSTRFISVRFGNVLGSSGSVLPLFREQIIKGGPVTVTHPDMTRYFMLIPEAAQLVLEAATIGEGGEIFILNMGEPVKIVDLANQLIRLMGKRPGSDVQIVFTGLRPGEKMHEQLVYDGSEQPTRMKKIMVTRTNPEDFEELKEKILELIDAAAFGNEAETRSELCKIVPEYTPDTSYKNE